MSLQEFLIEFGKMFRVLDFSNSQLIISMDSNAGRPQDKLLCENSKAILEAKSEIFCQMTQVFEES